MSTTDGAGPSAATIAWAAAAMGACNGSLAELISRRLPAQRSVFWPPSACDACGRRLRPWHNVPVISFVCLAGRCAFCRARIAGRSIWVELIMAAVGWLLWSALGLGWAWAVWMPLSAVAMAVALCDLDHFWVPDQLSLAGGALAVILALAPGARPLRESLAGLLPAVSMWGLAAAFARLRGVEGLGLGDIKWAAVLGLAVGGADAWSVVFWASLQGAAWGLWLRLRRPRAPRPAAPVPAALALDADWQPPAGAVPFAPFLSLAAAEVVMRPDVFVIGGGALRYLLAAG